MPKRANSFFAGVTRSGATDSDIVGAGGVAGAAGAASPVGAGGAGVSMPALGGVPAVLHKPRARRIANRRSLLLSIVAALVILVALVAAGRFVFYDTATATDFSQKNLAPSLEHLFGTDWMGRNMFARTVAGLSLSVLVGLLAAGVSSVIALVLASIAALGGRRADAVVTWLVDLFMGVPHIVLLILISYACGKGFWGVTIAVAVTHWPNLTRVLRAEIMQCRESLFVEHARKLGQGPFTIAVRHMLPYVFPQYLVGLILLFPHAIMHEAAITFLGFGLPVDVPAIGVILSESMSYLSAGMWWLAVFPGLALVATVMLFDVAGSSLRKLIDPHSTQE